VSDDARAARGRHAALALTWLRLALAPVLVGIGVSRVSGRLAAVVLAAGFLSDVFDGVVARHHGASTSDLRRLDSTVDTIFYLAVAYCAWRLHPDALRPYLTLVAILIGTEVLNYVAAIVRLGREASYHARTARLFGLLLFVALCTLLATGSGALLPLAIAAGFVSHAENLAITLVLPEWRHDVPSVFHAWRIRSAARRPPDRFPA
jgi:CDP-diacylglycerol--glycerol-3-phosphate 3-phosphatidyltransferase